MMHQLLTLKIKIFFVFTLIAIAFGPPIYFNLKWQSGLLIALVEMAVIIIGTGSWPLVCRLWWKPAWAINLNGEWKGEIISEYKHPDGSSVPPIETWIRIKQDWLMLSVTLRTDKITSRSQGPYLEYNKETDELKIKYFYETDPKSDNIKDNPPQKHGCARLIINLHDPETFEMHYTNERSNGGKGEFHKIN